MKFLIVVNNYLQKDVVSSKRWRCLSKEFARRGNNVTVLCGIDSTYNGTLLDIEHLSNANLRIIQLDTLPTFNFVNKYKRFLSFCFHKKNLQQSKQKNTSYCENYTANVTLSIFSILKILKEKYKYYILEKESRNVIASSKIFNELKTEHYDAIIASIYYENAFYMASYLHKFHRDSIFVCDIRDPLFNFFAHPTREYDIVHKKLGKRIFEECDVVTAVSDNLKRDLCSNIKDKDKAFKKCFVFPHAYDEEEDSFIDAVINTDNVDMSSVSTNSVKKQKDDALYITFTGSCLHSMNNVNMLFEAIEELSISRKIVLDQIVFNYAGQNSEIVLEAARKHNISEIIKDYGFLPKEVCLSLQHEADVLLNFSDGITGKIPEYLLSKKYIFVIHNKGSEVKKEGISELINLTKIGYSVGLKEKNCKEIIQDTLLKLCHEKQTIGAIPYRGDAETIKKYSIAYIAGQMLDCFRKCSSKGLPRHD